jgi:tetratricopeptide (TPR) repeat protein
MDGFQFQKAFDHMKRAVAVADDRSPYYLSLANAYNYVEEHRKAIRYYNLAIGENEGNAKAHSGLSMSYLETEKLPNAVSSINTAIALEPRHPYHYMNKANILSHFARNVQDSEQRDSLFDLAIASIERAQRLDSTFMCEHYDNNLGLVHYYKGDLETADSLYRRVRNFVTTNNRGVLFKDQGKFDYAEELFDTAMARNDQYQEPKWNKKFLLDPTSLRKSRRKDWLTYWLFLDNDPIVKQTQNLRKFEYHMKDLDPISGVMSLHVFALPQPKNKPEKVVRTEPKCKRSTGCPKF